jgi:pimeloyl-ACP methyl ester carboxylesterase
LAWQLKPYQKYLPNLEIREMEGNHWSFLVNPTEFNPIVAEFLKQFS